MTIRSLISGSAATVFISDANFATVDAGTPDGAHMSSHPTASKPGRPASAKVGMSGAAGIRVVELTPSARTLPSAIWDSAVPVSTNITETWPARTSLKPSGAPRYATPFIFVPVIAWNNSAVRCSDEPGPLCAYESVWSRKPYEKYAVSEFDNPLATRFDENDAAVLFENVKVPWERVFCHDNVEMTREIYMRTPGHVMANHQANVRFLEKLKLILGVAGKVADMNGARNIPAVQFTLGRLAAMEATLEGLIMGQINTGEAHPNGYHTVNRRYVYAALHWCSTHYAEICDTVRELMGAGVFQMPADESVLKDEKLRETFVTYWSVPGQSAQDRMKFLNLAWDLLGSDFAGRHMQYEKFYAGPAFVMNSYSYGTGPWGEWSGLVDDLLASYDTPGAMPKK